MPLDRGLKLKKWKTKFSNFGCLSGFVIFIGSGSARLGILLVY